MSTDRSDPNSGRVADAELVAAIMGGDPLAWGEVFDRYRDKIWQVAYSVLRRPAEAEDVVQSTFLTAVESISQLREPSRLRPWLLAIARRRALDVVRRSREIAHDPTDPIAAPFEEAVGGDGDELIAGIRRDEMSRLVTAAFDGLEPRDRAALELVERQGMSGDDLAETLGVTRDNAYALVHNAKDRFEASVSSLLVARQGREECGELDSLLVGWDGDLTPLVRKRIARHVKKCDACGETKRRQVTPAALLGLVPVVAMSTIAADQSKATAMAAATESSAVAASSAGAAAATGGAGAAVKMGALVAAVAILAGTATWVMSSRGDDAGTAAEREVPSTMAPAGGDSDDLPEPDQSPAVVVVTTVAPTTTAGDPVAITFCEAAQLLVSVASVGPASGSSTDIEVYMVEVNDLLQGLVLAAGVDVSDELTAYAEAYQSAVLAGEWDPAKITGGEQLSTLGAAVEADILASCGIG